MIANSVTAQVSPRDLVLNRQRSRRVEGRSRRRQEALVVSVALWFILGDARFAGPQDEPELASPSTQLGMIVRSECFPLGGSKKSI
jgi:hypothetical protein